MVGGGIDSSLDSSNSSSSSVSSKSSQSMGGGGGGGIVINIRFRLRDTVGIVFSLLS